VERYGLKAAVCLKLSIVFEGRRMESLWQIMDLTLGYAILSKMTDAILTKMTESEIQLESLILASSCSVL
jgi:hypothetical protein